MIHTAYLAGQTKSKVNQHNPRIGKSETRVVVCNLSSRMNTSPEEPGLHPFNDRAAGVVVSLGSTRSPCGLSFNCLLKPPLDSPNIPIKSAAGNQTHFKLFGP